MKCPTCRWPIVDGICRPAPWRVPKMLTDEEASKVVIPRIPAFLSRYDGRHWSDGSGRIPVFPEDKRIRGDAAARYLEAMGAPGCCTVNAPCARHHGALRGRDWKTGDYL